MKKTRLSLLAIICLAMILIVLPVTSGCADEQSLPSPEQQEAYQKQQEAYEASKAKEAAAIKEMNEWLAQHPEVGKSHPAGNYPSYKQDDSLWELKQGQYRQQQELQRLQDEQKWQMREYYLELADMYSDMADAARAQAWAIERQEHLMADSQQREQFYYYLGLADQYKRQALYYIDKAYGTSISTDIYGDTDWIERWNRIYGE